MPPYQFLIDGQELWDLAYYINSLGGQPRKQMTREGKEM
jgi:hypothetical protein